MKSLEKDLQKLKMKNKKKQTDNEIRQLEKNIREKQ